MLQRLVWTVLLAALIAVGAFVDIPIGPVPISLQTFFVMLAGFVLGPVYGPLAVTLYLAAGVAGLPVFAGGTAGWAKLLGPTGGFLFGFLAQAGLAGLATRGPNGPLSWGRGFAWGAISSIATLALGVPWLKTALDFSWSKALAVGMVPFLPGALVKLILAVAAYRLLVRWNLLCSAPPNPGKQRQL